MSSEEFKVGDVVELKSGGPHMTVSYIKDDSCDCLWFLEGDVERLATFNMATLKNVNILGS